MKRSLIPLLLLLATLPSLGQSPAMRARVDGIVVALNAAPDDYEAFAADAYAAELRARSTAAQRKEFVRDLQNELGKLEPTIVRHVAPHRVHISVTGSKGTRGTIVVEHELDAPHRITDLRFTPAAADDAAPPLPPVPVNGQMSSGELSAALDPYLTRLASEGGFAGTILVARDGQPVFEKSYGMANRSYNVPNTPRTRFNIGSINKHFTRTALAQLAAAGKLATTDTLAKHIPDYPNANARTITLQQLLDMTAGLADFFGPEFAEASKDRFRRNRDYYRFVAPKPLNFEPGSRREYCNSCYIVLGEIVERVSGMPYEQYVAAHVFRRAGMETAAFLSADEVAPDVAIGYTRQDGTLRANLLMHGAAGSAAGGAYATARDLLALDEGLRRAVLLDTKTTETFFKLGELVNGRATKNAMYAGGSTGVNAGVTGGGPWTVIAIANMDPPAADALARTIHTQLAK
ncbi:MAG TPA: serine hydrolase domain-containing protein [Thermoanaerobaculia bacterium]|nr:serine hydrolase domain-containing protein [Thermoanaerobaculia bacterium]